MLSSKCLSFALILFCTPFSSATTTYVSYLTSNDPNAPFASATAAYAGIPSNSILLSSYDINSAQAIDFGAPNPIVGKASLGPLQITKPIDFDTPNFFERMAAGEVWTGLTVGVYKVNSAKVASVVMQYRLGEVGITSITSNSPSSVGFSEILTFTYAGVIEIYHGKNANGSIGISVAG